MAYVPEVTQQRQGISGNIIHDGTRDYSSFALALTEDLGGELKRVTVVDRYVYRSTSIKKFGAFSTACSELGEGVEVRLLTSETPYLQMSTDYTDEQARAKYASKLAPHCSEVLFMESTKGVMAPHNRYIIVESSSENPIF